MMCRTCRGQRPRPVRLWRKKRTEERSVFPSSTHLGFRWYKFGKAFDELLRDISAVILRKLRLIDDPNRPKRSVSTHSEEDAQDTSWYSRLPWGRIAGWCIPALTLVCIYYFCGPVHRVAQTTYAAASAAMEVERPRSGEVPLVARIRSSFKTVMPQKDRGEVYYQILSWLQISRPDLNLKSRINEIDLIDRTIVAETICTLFHGAEYGGVEFKTGQTWTISRASTLHVGKKACLLVVLTGVGGAPETFAFAVTCYGTSYGCITIDDPENPPMELLRETLQSSNRWWLCSVERPTGWPKPVGALRATSTI